jgi:hypothetical protein
MKKVKTTSAKVGRKVGRPRKTTVSAKTTKTTKTITGNVSIIHDAFTLTTQGKSITIKL